MARFVILEPPPAETPVVHTGEEAGVPPAGTRCLEQGMGVLLPVHSLTFHTVCASM
jgi:hypothetical protein